MNPLDLSSLTGVHKVAVVLWQSFKHCRLSSAEHLVLAWVVEAHDSLTLGTELISALRHGRLTNVYYGPMRGWLCLNHVHVNGSLGFEFNMWEGPWGYSNRHNYSSYQVDLPGVGKIASRIAVTSLCTNKKLHVSLSLGKKETVPLSYWCQNCANERKLLGHSPLSPTAETRR